MSEFWQGAVCAAITMLAMEPLVGWVRRQYRAWRHKNRLSILIEANGPLKQDVLGTIGYMVAYLKRYEVQAQMTPQEPVQPDLSRLKPFGRPFSGSVN